MSLPSRQRGAPHPALRATAGKTTGGALTRAKSAAVQKRAHKPAAPAAKAISATKEAAATRHTRGSVAPLYQAKDATRKPASAKARRGGVNPMTAQLDLARAAGLLAADDKSSDDSSDEYGSDDDLDDSAETQATKMHAALLKRLADTDKRMLDKWLADDEQDYQANCAVLDQSTVTRRLETLNLFARHLQKVCKNRSSLLTRLAEPLAEEHWLLDPNYHQQLVNAFAAMNEIISQLPSIATAARHCLSPKLALKQQSSEEGHTAAEMPATTDNARQIAQMEKLIHEVEQADEWLQSSSMGSIPLPTVALSSNSGCVDRL